MVIGTQKQDLNFKKLYDLKRNKVKGSVKLKLYKVSTSTGECF